MVWDARSWQRRHVLRHDYFVEAVAIQDELIATTGRKAQPVQAHWQVIEKSAIFFWSASSGEQLFSVDALDNVETQWGNSAS